MRHVSLLLLGFLSLPLMAGTLSFRNDREGESYYAGNSYNREIYNVLREVEGKAIVQIYRNTLGSMNESNVCAYDLNRQMQTKLSALRPNFREMEGVIYYLRSQNEIDDVAAKILLTANKTVNTDLRRDDTDSRLPDRNKSAQMLNLVKNFQNRAKGSCFDDAYRGLINELTKIDKNTDRSFHAVLETALEKRLISNDIYTSLEQARLNELEDTYITLKSYGQKLRSLRANRPVDPRDNSDFITDKADKQKMSRRQRLMEYYSDFQIMLMADVVKKLRRRLEADRADILIYRKDELEETITLDPMERFRMAIKLLRKEMALLATNTYFNGQAPSYMDLMVASYEVGTIPSSELKEIAGMQDIWNPKKSFWDKAQTWIRGAGSIATIILPPPFGFIPALGIVVIEMTTGKDDNNNQDDPTRIF
jgi:hypothetical protein